MRSPEDEQELEKVIKVLQSVVDNPNIKEIISYAARMGAAWQLGIDKVEIERLNRLISEPLPVENKDK